MRLSCFYFLRYLTTSPTAAAEIAFELVAVPPSSVRVACSSCSALLHVSASDKCMAIQGEVVRMLLDPAFIFQTAVARELVALGGST